MPRCGRSLTAAGGAPRRARHGGAGGTGLEGGGRRGLSLCVSSSAAAASPSRARRAHWRRKDAAARRRRPEGQEYRWLLLVCPCSRVHVRPLMARWPHRAGVASAWLTSVSCTSADLRAPWPAGSLLVVGLVVRDAA